MSKQKREPQAVELDDDAVLESGANYGAGQIVVDDPDPNMRYYFAAKDDVENRPDGVKACQRMGYKISEKTSYGAPDSVLMEIPRDVWIKREKERFQQNMLRQQSVINPDSAENLKAGLRTLPGGEHGSHNYGS